MAWCIGWDVGAWSCDRNRASRDALVVMDAAGTLVGNTFRGNCRPAITQSTAVERLDALLRLVGLESAGSRITLAIDAPLRWPRAFTASIGAAAPAPTVGSDGKNIDNPLLFRRTEQEVAKVLHHIRERSTKAAKNKIPSVPLSPVVHAIGSQATKAQELLRGLGLAIATPGVWRGRVGACEVVAIETYPTPCRHSKRVQQASPTLPTTAHQDVFDAATCAVVAKLFADDPSRFMQPTPDDADEGWIWIPDDVGPPPSD